VKGAGKIAGEFPESIHILRRCGALKTFGHEDRPLLPPHEHGQTAFRDQARAADLAEASLGAFHKSGETVALEDKVAGDGGQGQELNAGGRQPFKLFRHRKTADYIL
jgi:hypothetical protein